MLIDFELMFKIIVINIVGYLALPGFLLICGKLCSMEMKYINSIVK